MGSLLGWGPRLWDAVLTEPSGAPRELGRGRQEPEWASTWTLAPGARWVNLLPPVYPVISQGPLGRWRPGHQQGDV